MAIKSGCGSAQFTIDDNGSGNNYGLVITVGATAPGYLNNTLCTLEITGVTNPATNVLGANDASITNAIDVDALCTLFPI